MKIYADEHVAEQIAQRLRKSRDVRFAKVKMATGWVVTLNGEPPNAMVDIPVKATEGIAEFDPMLAGAEKKIQQTLNKLMHTKNTLDTDAIKKAASKFIMKPEHLKAFVGKPKLYPTNDSLAYLMGFVEQQAPGCKVHSDLDVHDHSYMFGVEFKDGSVIHTKIAKDVVDTDKKAAEYVLKDWIIDQVLPVIETQKSMHVKFAVAASISGGITGTGKKFVEGMMHGLKCSNLTGKWKFKSKMEDSLLGEGLVKFAAPLEKQTPQYLVLNLGGKVGKYISKAKMVDYEIVVLNYNTNGVGPDLSGTWLIGVTEAKTLISNKMLDLLPVPSSGPSPYLKNYAKVVGELMPPLEQAVLTHHVTGIQHYSPEQAKSLVGNKEGANGAFVIEGGGVDIKKGDIINITQGKVVHKVKVVTDGSTTIIEPEVLHYNFKMLEEDIYGVGEDHQKMPTQTFMMQGLPLPDPHYVEFKLYNGESVQADYVSIQLSDSMTGEVVMYTQYFWKDIDQVAHIMIVQGAHHLEAFIKQMTIDKDITTFTFKVLNKS